MLLFTKVATAAGKIIQWQELKGDEVKLLKADASGNYVAVQYLNGEVQVWTLRHGMLDTKIGDSSKKYPTSTFFAFTWSGQDLVLSREYLSSDIKQENGDKKIPQSAQGDKGDTLRLDVQSGNVQELLPIAGRELAFDASSRYLAIANPSNQERYTASIEFYDLSQGPKRVKRVGAFRNKEWDAFGKATPFIVGWNPNGSGIYVVSSNFNTQQGTGQTLYFIGRTGTSREVLPQHHSLFMSPNNEKEALPLLFVNDYGNVACQSIFLDQADSLVFVNPQSVEGKIPGENLWDSVRGLMPTAQYISITPNQRFMLLQDTGKQAYLNPGEQADIWLIDIKLKLRKKIGVSAPIHAAYGWTNSGLLVQVSTGNKDISHSTFGVIYLDASTSIRGENIGASTTGGTDFWGMRLLYYLETRRKHLCANWLHL